MSLPANSLEKKIAGLIAAHGKPITIAEILNDLGMAVNDGNKRLVKGAVAALVMEHGLPIISRKAAPAGYKWATSTDDREAGAQELMDQAISMIRRARTLVKAHKIRAMLGQVEFIFDEDKAA